MPLYTAITIMKFTVKFQAFHLIYANDAPIIYL